MFTFHIQRVIPYNGSANLVEFRSLYDRNSN